MNINKLEYFVAVAETLNFTQAAKRCFISQTAMSLQIKALEEEVGIPLFIRDKHHVTLTSAGRVYLTEAREILKRMDEAAKMAKNASEGNYGSLMIGFIRGYEHSYLSDALRSFHQAYPDIKLDFVRDNMSNLYNTLLNNNCDLIFNIAPYLQSYQTLTHKYLESYQLMLVVYPEHPLAQRQSLTYNDLAEEEFIIMQPRGQSSEEVEEVTLCRERGNFTPKIIHREREVQTLLMMISAGLGIAILPEYCVRFYYSSENLKFIPLIKADGSPETIEFEISYKDNTTNPVVNTFLQWLDMKQYRG